MWEHEVAEGVQPQLAAEQVPYQIDVSAWCAAWGAAPAEVVCTLYDVSDDAAWVDVSQTKLAGSASVVGNVITTPRVQALTVGCRYRLQVQFELAGGTYIAYVRIACKR